MWRARAPVHASVTQVLLLINNVLRVISPMLFALGWLDIAQLAQLYATLSQGQTLLTSLTDTRERLRVSKVRLVSTQSPMPDSDLP